MKNTYSEIKRKMQTLQCKIEFENEENKAFVVSNDKLGIENLVVAVKNNELIMEQCIHSAWEHGSRPLKEFAGKQLQMSRGVLLVEPVNCKMYYQDCIALPIEGKTEIENSLNALSELLTQELELTYSNDKNLVA